MLYRRSEIARKTPLRVDRGDPADNTPGTISEAGVRAILEGNTHYADPRGTTALRQAIARCLAESIGVGYDPEKEILVTAGATPAIFAILMTFAKYSDSVMVPDPGWPTYLRIATALGLRVIRYPMPKTLTDVTPSKWFEELRSRVDSSTKVIIINTPHNPSGTVLDKVWLEAIAALCQEYPDLVVVSDEPYYQIIYDGAKHVSPASLPSMLDRTLVVHTFSKTYCMAGWRVGYVAGPARLMESLAITHMVSGSCASSISQAAAAWALSNAGDYVQEMRLRHEALRNFMVAQLNTIPFLKCSAPRGTFYLFPDITGFGVSSTTLAEELATKEELYVYPGAIYGPSGDSRIRICFALDRAGLEEVANRLRHFTIQWNERK